MSVFSDAEIAYLQSKTMGRLASIGIDGRPHLTPLTYHFNAEEDAIDLGGVDFGNTKKWRDMLQNPESPSLWTTPRLTVRTRSRFAAMPSLISGAASRSIRAFPTSSPNSSECDRIASSVGGWKRRASCRTLET
jgi:hypothetical protein